MIKITLALKKLHSNKIYHFDIKEDNIFMMNKFTPVLGDLGMAHRESQLKEKMPIMGTTYFLSPEGKIGIYNSTTDIYALGVLFYEILIGKFDINHQEFQAEFLTNENNPKILKEFTMVIFNMIISDSTKRISLDVVLKNLIILLRNYANIHIIENYFKEE